MTDHEKQPEADATGAGAPPAAPPIVSRPPTGLFDPRLRATLVLLLLNALALVHCSALPEGAASLRESLLRVMGENLDYSLFNAGAFAGYLLEAGEYWRLAASLFLHQGLLHYVLNMLALFFFAIWLEPLLGRARFLILYLGSGVAGNLFGYGWNTVATLAGQLPMASIGISVGASGAVFGLLGAMVAAEWIGRGSILALSRSGGFRRLATVVIVLLSVGVFFPGIDWKAHVGGFLAGMAIGLFFFSRLRSVILRQAGDAMLPLGANALGALLACCVVALFASTRPLRSATQEERERDTMVIMMLEHAFGRPDVALRWTERRIQAGDETPAWLERRADLLGKLCRYDEAIDAAQEALARGGAEAAMTYRRGVGRWRLEQVGGALADFEAAERIVQERPPDDPEEAEGLRLAIGMARAMALGQAGRRAEAAEARDALAAPRLADADRLTSMAVALSRAYVTPDAGDTPTTATSEAILEIRLRAAQLRNNVAWLYAELGSNIDRGLEQIRLALEVHQHPAYLDTYGWLLYRAGRLDEAAEVLLAARAGMPLPSAEVEYHLGAVYAGLGELIVARRHLERSLALRQDFDAIAEARQLLDNLGPAVEGPARPGDIAGPVASPSQGAVAA